MGIPQTKEMTKRKPPYDHLLARFEALRDAVEAPARREMFVLPKDSIKEQPYLMFEVAERVQAANTLGWNVQLRWDKTRGLVIEYVKRVRVP